MTLRFWRIFGFAFLFSSVFSFSSWAEPSPAPSAAPAAAAPADDSRISVKAEVNKAFITIGDPVLYTITITHDESIQVNSAIAFPDQDILKVKKSQDFKRVDGKTIYEGKNFTLTAFSLGEFVLSPVEIHYSDAGQAKTISTDPIYITVKSVAEGEEKTDIRGIKGVIAIPSKWMPFVYGAGALALAGLLAYLYFRFRKKPSEGGEMPLNRTIEEEALAQLSQLFDSDLIRRGKIKEYYLKMSEILKTYFERRFHILALESTTYEIQKALKDKEVDMTLRELSQEVLDACDLAKFAKWKPEPAEIIAINQKSTQIIELAKPKEARNGV